MSQPDASPATSSATSPALSAEERAQRRDALRRTLAQVGVVTRDPYRKPRRPRPKPGRVRAWVKHVERYTKVFAKSTRDE